MVSEDAANIATSAINAMKSAPLALALLLVNMIFLGFSAYILREVSVNSSERNKSQIELITNMARDLRDCRLPVK